MKKFFNIILVLLTIGMLALLSFNKINMTTNWVDLSAYQTAIGYVAEYGPMVLVCLFAFGSLVGKVLSKILFIIIILLLIIFSITTFAPNWISAIFGG